MNKITEHQFVENGRGGLMLLFEAVPGAPKAEPVLLVDPAVDMAFLHRGEQDMHCILGISPTVIGTLRKAESILVVEMEGDKTAHVYDTVTSLLEIE